MPASGYTGYYCPHCDRANPPVSSPLVQQMAGKQRGMLLKCSFCNRSYEYDQLLKLSPRCDKPEFVERPLPKTIPRQLFAYPEVWAALETKFPQNLLTTLTACLTSLADPDTVLIEGEHARELSALGIKRGREILGLAREVLQLRKDVADMRIREEALRPFFNMMQGAFAGQAGGGQGQSSAPMQMAPATDATLLPDGHRNPDLPPPSTIGTLTEDADGFVMPGGGRTEPAHPFALTEPAATPSTVPGFVTRLARQ